MSGRPISIGIKTSPQGVDWPTLDAAWARIGEHDVFESVWLNDHLTDPRRSRGGSSFEAMTAIAALAHRVPGKWVGHAVLSATFRHPSVLAKQATALDHATRGRFAFVQFVPESTVRSCEFVLRMKTAVAWVYQTRFTLFLFASLLRIVFANE